MNIVLPIITGLFGLATGLIIPFIKWHIDKLKIRHSERLIFISQLRETISSDDFDVYKFKDTPLYSRFRKYIPLNVVDRIEFKDGIIKLQIIIAGSRGGLNNELLDIITTLEEKWKLI